MQLTDDEPATWVLPIDSVQFAALMREHQDMVFSLACHFLRDRASAEDLTQEVFFTLYQNLHRIQSSAHLKFWLRQVTSRRCIDFGRRARLRRFLSLQEAPEPATEITPADPALERRLQQLVAALPSKPRMMLLLRYQEDLDAVEIGELLGIPLNTVKSSLRRSLKLLRERLNKHMQRTSGTGHRGPASE